MVVWHEFSAVHCLVLPEASKSSLASNCRSSHCFGFGKANELLKAYRDFGVGDETCNRNNLQLEELLYMRQIYWYLRQLHHVIKMKLFCLAN